MGGDIALTSRRFSPTPCAWGIGWAAGRAAIEPQGQFSYLLPMDRAPLPLTLKERRRKFVKRNGKKLFRRLAAIMSADSRVGDTPVLANEHFDALKPFVENWEKIRDEVKVILKHREEIPAFHEISPDQHKISTGKNWRTFILYGFGKRLEKNCAQAPFTAELLAEVPDIQIAMFSILSPGYHIPPHEGVTKGIVRAHLGLIIPTDAEKCWIRVDDQIKVWRPGEIFVFDDTYTHEVYNNTDEERVILLFDFDRPMGWKGRTINKLLLTAMKFSAFYQTPKKRLADAEARFEAATRQNTENLEKLSDDD
jgi:ornithine lipid ester-linked acyl 2-hydroxylase